MRRRIHFHGPLKALHPEPIEIDSLTVAEAIAAVTQQIPGFRPNAVTGRRQIQVAGFRTEESLYAPSDVEDIHIFPPMSFGKHGGILQIIIGFALVILAIGLSFLGVPPSVTLKLALFGGAMILGGLAQLLSPQPGPSHRSRYITNNQNTVAIGTPVPLLYGRRRVPGQILSLNIFSQDNVY